MKSSHTDDKNILISIKSQRKKNAVHRNAKIIL